MLTYQTSQACFCEEETVGTADYSRYDELFLGKVLKIERIETTEIHEGITYNPVGIITTFEVIQKWKGDKNKIIKIYQSVNSCSMDYPISTSRWIVGAYKKHFIQDSFKEKYPDRHLQTDVCSINIEERDYKQFGKDINELNKKFPNSIELENPFVSWTWILSIALILMAVLVFVFRNSLFLKSSK
ncbi:MAG: hypothetical protein AAGI23_02030 [Bacteroidota bacterium]